MIKHSGKTTQKGAASLFMVVFSILLLTLIALSFTKLVLRGARTSTENDLSQSAYDSAMAGVEDAKRALVKYNQTCSECISGGACTQECNDLKPQFNGESCDVVKNTLGSGSIDEQALNVGSGNSAQAYTCVKVAYNTDDYVDELATTDGDVLIPLYSVAGSPIVSQLEINWFSKEDLSNPSNLDLPAASPAGDFKLVPAENWSNNRPPILMVQYIKLDKVENYDIQPQNQQSVWTLGLYPTNNSVGYLNFFATDVRRGHRSAGNYFGTPMSNVRCEGFANHEYACSAKIYLHYDAGAGVNLTIPAKSNKHFLRISKRYASKAHFQVKMKNVETDSTVLFSGVQPLVDSNGRADDLFRRVHARVIPDNLSGLSMPSSAVEIAKGDFCKNLSVNDNKAFMGDCFNP